MDPTSNDGKTTQMIAPQSATKTKMVKIRALSPVLIDAKTNTVLEAGKTAEVTEEVAKEFCDKKFVGNYDFAGERSDVTATRHAMVRAERVQ